MEKKYIFENGVMKLNPAYQREQAAQGIQSTVANPNQSLAIVSSTDDIAKASAAQQQATGRPMQLSDATTNSMNIMQDDEFLNQFGTQQRMDGGQLLDGLSSIFAKHEIPIGLVNKLLALTEYNLDFIVDDSGSMGLQSDVSMKQASMQIKQKCDPRGQRAQSFNSQLTRWEEAEDRIHVLIDMLAFIPSNPITISFLNRSDKLVLDHRGKTPEQFAQDAHQKVMNFFNRAPSGGTPIHAKLSQAFQSNNGAAMHYLFTDGEPSDGKERVINLIRNRNHQMHPLTFMSCTNNDDEAEWMKTLEGEVPYTSELDDFETERKEVYNNHGPGFPYSRGFWLLCQMVSAINPHDLDKMDEPIPFTKMTLNNLLGRRITDEEYRYYYQHNPKADQSRLNEFIREDVMAHQLTGQRPYQTQQPMQQPSYSSNPNTFYNQPYGNRHQNPPPVNPETNPSYIQPGYPPFRR